MARKRGARGWEYWKEWNSGREKGQKNKWKECGRKQCLLFQPLFAFSSISFFSIRWMTCMCLLLLSWNVCPEWVCVWRCVCVCWRVLSVLVWVRGYLWACWMKVLCGVYASRSHAANNKNPWSYIKDFTLTHTHSHSLWHTRTHTPTTHECYLWKIGEKV